MERLEFGRRRLRLESLEPRLMLHGGGDSYPLLAAEGEPTAMPDFALVDVNSSSSTANQEVSPRDFLQSVSGWYFGGGL